jgi:hypothetical protein
MTGIEHTWPADTFDAISIKTGGSRIIAVGTDDSDFKLKSGIPEKKRDTLSVNQSQRWLQLSSVSKNSDTTLTLYLPRQKTWLLELVGHQGSFQAEDINAWLHLMLGKGQISVKNSRGALTVISANSDVSVQGFVETEVPEKPPQPEETISEKPVTSAKFPDWGKDDWANWGLDIGQKVFRKIFDQTEDGGKNPGISLKIAKGNLSLRDMEAQKCVVRSARSDAVISGGRISNLDINLARGNIACDSCVPDGEWNLQANNGNISLSVIPDVIARLNASTRSGEINSSVPLVKVTRQGPGAWHGGRMVGTLGTPSEAKEKIPEIRLMSLKGNINIDAASAKGKYHGRPPAPRTPSPPSRPSRKARITYKTPVEVLEALSKGRISVDDAESILDNLGYWNKSP